MLLLRQLMGVVVAMLTGLYAVAAWGAETDGFRVAGFPEVAQGLSQGELVRALEGKQGTCKHDLVRSSHDASIFVVRSCDEPKVYVSFCNGKLYWASTYLPGGFSSVVSHLWTATGIGGPNAEFKVENATGRTKIIRSGEVAQDYEMTLHLRGSDFGMALTMFAAGQDGEGVADDYRIDYQSNLDPKECRLGLDPAK